MIICADDYGLREDIDEAILDLCRAGRLDAVSCMVALKRCDRGAMAALLATRTPLDRSGSGHHAQGGAERPARAGSATLGPALRPHIGLHLTFTHEPAEMEPLPVGLYRPRLPTFGTLVRRSLTHRLDLAEVNLDVSTQYGLFVKKCGCPPDFIDGHLHAHQLPGIRERLIEFALRLPVEQRPYIRNTAMPLRELRKRGLPWTKAAGIGFFGKQMARALDIVGLKTNEGFAGIYDFNKGERYAAYFRSFTDALTRNGILVVHPGKEEPWRLREFQIIQTSIGLDHVQRKQATPAL